MIDFRWRGLSSPIVSDVLDALGHRDQVMDPAIKPLDDETLMVGRAKPALWVHGEGDPGTTSYQPMIDFLEELSRGDVVVFAVEEGLRISVWGDLLSAACEKRGVAGMVTDGLIRDPVAIRAIEFPVFSVGSTPTDPAGRALARTSEPRVVCGGVPVASGDLLIGDADGCVVVPPAAETDVLEKALALAGQEAAAAAAIRSGATVREVFEDLGVL